MLTSNMDLCVDQNIAVFIGGLALINRCIAELNVGQDQCPRTHMPSGVQICPYNTQRDQDQTTEAFSLHGETFSENIV